MELIHEGHKVVLVEINLSNSEIYVHRRLENLTGENISFFEVDLCNEKSYLPLEQFAVAFIT